MRLICPKCGAEYEPPKNMMPSGGRYVQCSACHTRWFAKGDIRPLLTEEQIIARLESRAPNLKIVDEPMAAPWAASNGSASRRDVAVSPEDAADGAAETTDTPEPDDRASDLAAGSESKAFRFSESVVDGSKLSAEGDDEGFTWEAPKAASDHMAFAEAPSGFTFKAPSLPSDESGFTWEEAEAGGASGTGKPETPPEGPNIIERVKASSHPSVTAASQVEPLRGAQAAPRAEVAQPRIVIQAPPKNLFWRGLAVPVLIFAALVLAYFAARGLADGGTGPGRLARSLVGLVDALRLWLSNLFSAA
jgi:predicted Zn finger-like uncharacterized protein